LTGVAVKVTGPPGQKGFDDGLIETLTTRFGLTVIRIWMLDAGLFVVQTSDEVRMQDTRSRDAGK
jgi:hypothetical protein